MVQVFVVVDDVFVHFGFQKKLLRLILGRAGDEVDALMRGEAEHVVLFHENTFVVDREF